jgi:hypothetical protein
VPATPDADQLRRRAVDLRRLAARLDGSLVPTVVHAGDGTTWRGPTASAFQDESLRARTAWRDAIDALVVAARALERLADEARASGAS